MSVIRLGMSVRISEELLCHIYLQIPYRLMKRFLLSDIDLIYPWILILYIEMKYTDDNNHPDMS